MPYEHIIYSYSEFSRFINIRQEVSTVNQD